ncbi:hypothetical protein [Kitasatospora sp. McL0602]|uniref:hypothetical protein n=1 Tax=Kitasatospora sp. McL0602 TaxID=3439530 RepID=UPI003F893DAC
MKKRFARRMAAIALGLAVAAGAGAGTLAGGTTAWDSGSRSEATAVICPTGTTAWGDDCDLYHPR